MLSKLLIAATAMAWVLPSTAHGQLLTPRAAVTTSASMTFATEIGDPSALSPQCQSFMMDVLGEFPEPPVDLGEWLLSNPGIPADPCAYSTLLPSSLRGEWTTYVIGAESWISSNWNSLTSSFVADCGGGYVANLGCTKLATSGPAATATSTSVTGSGSGSAIGGGAIARTGTQNAGLPRETGIVGGAAAAVGAIAVAMLV
jgi:hypothetical protein